VTSFTSYQTKPKRDGALKAYQAISRFMPEAISFGRSRMW